MPAGTLCPCPHGSRNPGWSDDADEWITGEVVDRLPGDLPDDTVLVGIIDTGIALGHRAFRRANGSSRVISAWQQTALYRNQPYLPFGEEWYAGDIDGRLRDHSRNRNPMDRLDEDGFNRAMRLVEPGRIRGHRDLDHRAAHGTHVMDIAAGFDPSHPDADRVRMIVVNLPTQYLHGSAGNFLSYFAAYAVERVFHMAEALWTKNNPSKPGGAYPLAVNLAYGMMAGPKDGAMPLERLIAREVQVYQQKAPTSFCMPSGNENLARGVARDIALPAKAWSPVLPWRIQPSDRTSNYLEFWIYASSGSAGEDLDKYRFHISAPNGASFEVDAARDGHYHDLPEIGARLYCRVQRVGGRARALQFILATAPTLVVDAEGARRVSPAGLWRIRVLAPREAGMVVFVQSDQSATTHSNAGLRSYFDHEAYRPHLPSGRLRDSFSYPRTGASGGSRTRRCDGVTQGHPQCAGHGGQDQLDRWLPAERRSAGGLLGHECRAVPPARRAHPGRLSHR